MTTAPDPIPTVGPNPIKDIQTIRPAFAVRGLNCMACHGIIGSSVITDFGYGTPNFDAVGFNTQAAFGNERNAWQQVLISGSLHIPQASITPAQAAKVFGATVSQNVSLLSLLETPDLPSAPQPPISSSITPAPGQPAIIEEASIHISYPSESEITSLLPAAQASQAVAFAPITVQGLPATKLSGLALDASGKFVRNSGVVQCTGDVVIKGTLFLKNLQLQTDSGGCRLYVSQTVFIQGPIAYVSGSSASANLQITSARAIAMGFSLRQMGLNSSGTGRISGATDNNLTSPGGNWARFAQVYDAQYDPANIPINGISRKTFFDNIMKDGVLIGSELLDAGDQSQFGSLVPGETVTDPGLDEGGRISIDYRGLLLNAPHVHSRYAGSLKGVVIGDVAMLARNPSTANAIEQYVYDPIFDSVSFVLPALKTNILQVTKP